MARRALPTITTAFTVAAALLLAGCGGGDDASSGGIEGADTGSGSPSASASATASASAVKRPDVSLPDDLSIVFDFDKPSDEDHAAALADAGNYLRALDHGITRQDPTDRAFQFYSSGQAFQYAHGQIKEYVDGGWTLTGKERYYRAETATTAETKAVKLVRVTFCSDQSKVYGKEVKTDKILYTKDTLASYQKFSLVMALPKGSAVWRASQITVTGKAAECRD
ncbi:hypothetical protein ACIQOU_21185 [Streptomyces sp. NPDC091279]|uniref:hypothetical protein n=1 Tax=unclassified Streptomyces TaxID=2593676 RepID=UPI0037F80CFA